MDYYPNEDEEFELMHSDDLELLKEQEDINYKPNGTRNKSIENSQIELNKGNLTLLSNNTLNNEFPSEEEEFELMHSDDLELLKEQDVGERVVKSRKILNFGNSTCIGRTQNSETLISNESYPQNDFIPLSKSEYSIVENISEKKDNVNNDFTPLPTSEKSTAEAISGRKNNSNVNKRTIEELFGDIDDLLSENTPCVYGSVPKKYKKSSKENEDLALMAHIISLRKLSRERNDSAAKFGRNYTSDHNKNLENLSYRVPSYPFLAVTNHNGERVYIRFHSEEYEKEEVKRIVDRRNFSGVMGQNFKDIWEEANQHINNSLNIDVNNETVNMETANLSADIEDNKSLWVDLYKPRKYYELLSDESTNRILLRWLKLWDKIVFNIRPKLKPMKTNEKIINSKFKNPELSLELDEHGCPQYKVALLCGPPGLGKTTLAHMVAKHAGYNVVEINASDDRNIENFKTALENATSMRSVLDKEKRPNCLVFDEIDGAPSSSIDFLIKFINGNHVTKAKKGKTQTKHVLKRPIICICNDVYVPALRSLRQIAFVVNFPPTSSTRLAERLSEISRKQQIKTDMGALIALAEKSHNDIRSCLSFLHFFKSQNKPVTLSDIMKASVGEKDVQKGLFAVWNDIFQIERVIKKDTDKRCIDVSLTTRMKKVLQTVNSFGDFERVMQGVFENYPKMKVRDSSLVGTCEALEWFCLSDVLNRHILMKQDYSLATYLPFGFVVWHFVFASMEWQKIIYPSVNYEVRTKKNKHRSLLYELNRGIRPNIRAYINPTSLKMDIVPHLTEIIVPNLRPVNFHLYTQQEKNQLSQVVNIMIDYNLNYVQERTLQGNYVYNLDPNLEELKSFPGFKPKRFLTYANRQLIAHEIELEKMRLVESQKISEKNLRKEGDKNVKGKQKEVPNHLQKLQTKTVKPNEVIITKDFFGNEIRKEAVHSSKSGGLHINNDIFFQFKEGFTNAVRKKIKIIQLK